MNFKRIINLASGITICGILCFIVVDYAQNQLNRDFLSLQKLIRDVALNAFLKNELIIVTFDGKNVVVKEGNKENTYWFQTLSEVDYDTSLGRGVIGFNRNGTSNFNKRIHGGVITLQSLFGKEKRYMHINCQGAASEGQYPEN